MWGLGIEHELAPAVLTASGVWQKIRPQKLNDKADAVEQAASGVGFVDSNKLTFLRVQPGTTPIKRWTSAMRSLLSWCEIYFMKGEASIARREYESDTPLPSDGLQYHASLCKGVAGVIADVCKTNGFKRVSVVVEYQYGTAVIVYPESDGMELSEIADALYASTAHVVYRKNSVTRVRGQFEIDSGFIEIKSEKPLRASVASIADELAAREREVISAAKKVADAMRLSPMAAMWARVAESRVPPMQ